VLKNVDDGSFEVVLRGRAPLLSDLDVAVVDAAVINGAKRFRTSALGNKNCRFRRDFCVGEGDELVMRVEEDMFFRAIGGFMLPHSVGGFSDVWIYKPKHYVLCGEFVFEALHLRKVAIGDGAVGRNKKENNSLRTRNCKIGNRLTTQAVAVRWHSLCMRDERDSQHRGQGPYSERCVARGALGRQCRSPFPSAVRSAPLHKRPQPKTCEAPGRQG
jgi:hypothetical protein